MKNIILLLLFISTGALAQETNLPKLIPEELEIELALSSLPPHLRDEATVYVYKRGDGLVLKRKGTNGFTAFVERIAGMPGAFAPVAYDAEGTLSIVPRIIDENKMIEQGKTRDQIDEAITENFANNKYGVPRTTGIAYMLSPVNILPSPLGKPALWYPHFMVYAPFAKSSDFGFPKFEWHGYLPIVLNSGPHGLMIIRLGEEETRMIREENKDLISKMEKFLGRKLESFDIMTSHKTN